MRAVEPPQAKLITADALAARLGDRDLRIFDATQSLERPDGGGPYSVHSGQRAYRDAHIPGAAFADVDGAFAGAERRFPFELPGRARFAAAAGRAGVSQSRSVVVYSAGSPMWATRLWWLFRVHGFDEVHVLDGGLDAWRRAGLALARGSERHPPAAFTAQPRPALLADRDEVASVARGANDAPLVNALGADAFAGRGPSSYSRPGRIPRSRNVPWRSLLDTDGCFRATPELRSLIEPSLGTAAPIAYCGAGISATVFLFALSLIGRQDGRLYDGSLAQWSADPELPMAVG